MIGACFPHLTDLLEIEDRTFQPSAAPRPKPAPAKPAKPNSERPAHSIKGSKSDPYPTQRNAAMF